MAGDVVTSVAGVTIGDYLDVELAISGEGEVELSVERGGEELALMLNRSSLQGMFLSAGLELEFSPRICPNNCIFCFVDQNPPGMRQSIYVKDEDYRLSFTDGAYITLTNLTAEDKARISALRLSPLYVSVHTTDDRLRREILGNARAEPIIPALKELVGLGVSVHTQVVVMPGINDGVVLERTLRELSFLHPGVASVAVVPLGLTRWREGLHHLKPVGADSAREILGIVDEFQREFMVKIGTRFAFCADEFFITARREFPGGDYYEGYPQLEDGVGLWVCLREGFYSALEEISAEPTFSRVTVVSSTLAEPLLRELCREVWVRWRVKTDVVAVPNRLFGETVGVAGLLWGEDIAEFLTGRELSEFVLVPASAVDGEGRFIDDVTVEALSERLGRTIRVVEIDGGELLGALLGLEED